MSAVPPNSPRSSSDKLSIKSSNELRHDDKQGRDPVVSVSEFREAAESGDLGKVRIAIQQRIEVNCQNKNGWTALHGAVANHHADVVDVLISAKAEINMVNCHGRTPLHKAAYYNAGKRIVKRLVEAKGDVTLVDSAGHNVLHMLAWYSGEHYRLDTDRILMASTFLKLGASPCLSQTNKNGDTPFDVALTNKYSGLIKFYRKLNAPFTQSLPSAPELSKHRDGGISLAQSPPPPPPLAHLLSANTQPTMSQVEQPTHRHRRSATQYHITASISHSFQGGVLPQVTEQKQPTAPSSSSMTSPISDATENLQRRLGSLTIAYSGLQMENTDLRNQLKNAASMIEQLQHQLHNHELHSIHYHSSQPTYLPLTAQ